MDKSKAPELIFDKRQRYLRRERAARRPDSFLLHRCAQDIAERLKDINRQFENALIIGPFGTSELITAELPVAKVPRHIEVCRSDFGSVDKAFSFPVSHFDLIISLLGLHGVNDLPGSLLQSRHLLRPDGVFIGAMFGGQTLTELRQACFETDENLRDGFSPRVFPFANYSQAAGLLGRAGFALPVVDVDRVNVRYSSLGKLLNDLRDLGETNYLATRDRTILTKTYFATLEKNYVKHHSNEEGKLAATFEILWLTGWAPHESQQKPLKPGSAKVRLADVLNTVEQKPG
jgi:SAM-dependent methyltransferase